MKLYGYWRSSCTWRVRIGLLHKGVPHTYEPVHLTRAGGQQNTEDYRALNPLRTVPLLEWEEGGHLQRLSQSLAILELLEELHPEPALLPKSPVQRAKVRMIAESINSGIQPLQNLVVLQRVKNELGGDERAWAAHWIDRGMTAVETQLAQTAGDFCVGDAVSFADLCLIPQLYNLRRFGLDASKFPTALRIEGRCEQLPAFEKAHPSRQADAEP